MFLIFLPTLECLVYSSCVIQPPPECALWVKQQGHEAKHSPQPTLYIKNEWSYISTLYIPSCHM